MIHMTNSSPLNNFFMHTYPVCKLQPPHLREGATRLCEAVAACAVADCVGEGGDEL